MPRATRKIRLFAMFGLGTLLSLISIILIVYFIDVSGVQYPSTDRDDPGTLISVQAIFRHGDRTPGRGFPTDPYRDGKQFPGGWAALTMAGKLRLLSLGRTLRERYSDFLPSIFFPHQVYVQSSAADRCIMSAQSLLAGLFPPTQEQSIEPQLGWQPIPVHSSPRDIDKTVAAKRPCALYDSSLAELYASPKIKAVDARHADLYATISKGSGLEITSVAQAEGLYNTLDLQQSLNLSVPAWATKSVMADLRELAILSLQLFTHTHYMTRIRAGPLIAEVRNRMIHNTHNSQEAKLFLVSGHDLTLINVLRGLGLTEHKWKPDFAAMLVVELHAHKLGNIVKMLYSNGHGIDPLNEITIPACPKPCRLDTFLAATESVIPIDWELECQQHTNKTLQTFM